MPAPVPGQPFGRYLVQAFVAQGGMGAIYRATDPALGRSVALKVLLPDDDATDSVPRFIREARIAANLAHPNVVVIYEVGNVEETPYLAMEWVDGQALRQLVGRGEVSASTRLRIIGEIASALAFAHERGVVHRDVKPSNVLIDSAGSTKLLDFGIAKSIRRPANALPSGTFQTLDGELLGTPMYMAPEQAYSANVTPAADQYAWAVVAYEVLTGKHPRDAVVPDRTGTRLVWPTGIDPALARIIDRAMERDPAKRFASMREVEHEWLARTHATTSRHPLPLPGPDEGATIQEGAGRLTTSTRRESTEMGRRTRTRARARRPSLATPFLIGLGVAFLITTILVGVFIAKHVETHDASTATVSAAASASASAIASVTAAMSASALPIVAPPPVPETGDADVPTSRTVDARAPTSTPSPPHTSRSAAKSEAKDAGKGGKERGGPPHHAILTMSSPTMRVLDDDEVARAEGLRPMLDACVAREGEMEHGDQFYVTIYFDETKARITTSILREKGGPMPPRLFACVDPLFQRLRLNHHSPGIQIALAYDV